MNNQPIRQQNVFFWVLLLSLYFCVSSFAYAQDNPKVHVCDETCDTLISKTVDVTGEEPVKAGEHSDEAGTVLTITTEDFETKAPPTYLDFLLSNKYIAFLIISFISLVLLLARWTNIWIRIAMLLVAFVLFGLDYIYPLHPSPMCGITKLFMFKFTWGEFFPQFLAMFVAIFLPSLIGRKLFCGWVCPLGALQDLVNKIPFKWQIRNFSFTVFNSIRGSLLLMFVLVFFGVRDHLQWLAQDMQIDSSVDMWTAYSAYSIYEPINFFELLHWGLNLSFFIMMSILVVGSLILYRPFCYLICPIGFLTWIVEKIAPGRIRIDHSTCNNCSICYDKSPCPTIKPMVEQAKVLPDCTSCGECIDTCPKNSIKFGFFPLPKSKPEKVKQT